MSGWIFVGSLFGVALGKQGGKPHVFLSFLWCTLPRDARTGEHFFANEWVFRIKPLKVF